MDAGRQDVPATHGGWAGDQTSLHGAGGFHQAGLPPIRAAGRAAKPRAECQNLLWDDPPARAAHSGKEAAAQSICPHGRECDTIAAASRRIPRPDGQEMEFAPPGSPPWLPDPPWLE